jgi:hypothetical protein
LTTTVALWRRRGSHWMDISRKSESRASNDSTEMAVECSDDELRVSLADGRRL